MKDEPKPSALSFILHPSSFILHPSSFILHPSSFILHPSPFTLHPSPFTLHPSFTLHLHPSSSSLPPLFQLLIFTKKKTTGGISYQSRADGNLRQHSSFKL